MKIHPTASLLFVVLHPFVRCSSHSHLMVASLEQIVGTPNETLEAVQALYENWESSVGDNFAGLEVMKKTANPEALKYVLSKTVSMNSYQRASYIVCIIKAQLSDANFSLTSNDKGFSVIQVCLVELTEFGMLLSFQDDFRRFVQKSIYCGNPDLLKLLLNSGAPLPDKISIGPAFIRDNIIPIIHCLLDHGLSLASSGQNIVQLLQLPSFRAHDLDRFFRCGLQVQLKFFTFNWLELAIQNGRLDLAHVAFKHGLWLKSSEFIICPTPRSGFFGWLHCVRPTIEQLANYIAIQNLFGRVRAFLEATYDPRHVLCGLSLASIFGQIFAPELEAATNQIMSFLFR